MLVLISSGLLEVGDIISYRRVGGGLYEVVRLYGNFVYVQGPEHRKQIPVHHAATTYLKVA